MEQLLIHFQAYLEGMADQAGGCGEVEGEITMRFTSYYISGVREVWSEGEVAEVKTTTDQFADYWTLYGRRLGLSEAVADRKSRRDCEELFLKLFGSFEHLEGY